MPGWAEILMGVLAALGAAIAAWQNNKRAKGKTYVVVDSTKPPAGTFSVTEIARESGGHDALRERIRKLKQLRDAPTGESGDGPDDPGRGPGNDH